MSHRRTAILSAAALAAGLTCAAAQVPARIVPAGTVLDLLLQTALDSGKAGTDQPFTAATLEDLVLGGQTMLAAGQAVTGFVSSVRPSGRLDHQGQMTLSFSELRVDERPVRFRASVIAVLDPRRKNDLDRLGGTPPPIDRNAGRDPDPLSGVVVRAGGTIVSMNVGDVNLPAGVILRVRLDRPLELAGVHQH
jgi:hypothetical protein